MSDAGVPARLVVLTKVGAPGTVKTRLAPLVGLEGAAALHRAMVSATLDVAMASGLPTVVALAGDADSIHGRALIANLAERGIPWFAQAEGDLGRRMAHSVLRAAPPLARRQVAIGTDCPVMKARWLHQAATTRADIAIGPTDDGGYWTIAVDTRREGLVETVFTDIPWSTGDVLARTIDRSEAAGLRVALLHNAYDVDEPADLLRLRVDPRCPLPLSALLSHLLG